ncbi:MAG: cupin domain-containing protein [Candidatus Kapaibacterium sp.]|nr:MAG: cupin domain-containing protein [Candidatus Kapabacteria bacterium]
MTTTHNHHASEELLNNAAALSLGALLSQEARDIFGEITQSSATIRKEYTAMVWTAHHLPAAVPLVQPPASLKERIMSKIAEQENQSSPKHHSHAHLSHAHEEFIPEYDAKGADFYSVLGSHGAWMAHPVKGIRVKPLATDKERGYATLLMQLDAGTLFPSHNHAGAEQCYVLSGSVNVMGKIMNAGDFFSTQASADHGDILAPEAATVLLVVAMEDYKKSAWKIGVKHLWERLTSA